MFWLLFFISVATWIVYYRWQRRMLYKIAKAIPSGIQSYPIIGHAYVFSGNDEDRMKGIQLIGRKSKENGGLSAIWMMHKLYVNVADPEAAETIGKACVHKDESTSKFFRALIGNGSIFAPVNIWRPRRKILAPIFSLKNMHQFVSVFNEQSVIMTKLLAPMVDSGDFSIWKYITAYTFDAVCETTLDMKMDAQSKPHVPFLTKFDSLLGLLAQRLFNPWMYPDFIYKRLTYHKQLVEDRELVWDLVDKVVQRKRKEQKAREQEGNETSGRRTFLDMMIERSSKGDKGYTDLELREEAMVIILAGTDTSAVGASFTTVLLSRYPLVQEKVYQELQDVFGTSERPVTPEDLPKLKYLEVVIKECLRLYPPVPIISREIEENVIIPTGDTLVNGTKIIINIWALHRNPRYWGDDAEQFRPERFLETPLVHPSQYQPFSQFARSCLGLNYAMNSMKTVLATLLRRYKVLHPQNMDSTKLKEPLAVKYNIMMKHVDDYVVRLVKRE